MRMDKSERLFKIGCSEVSTKEKKQMRDKKLQFHLIAFPADKQCYDKVSCCKDYNKLWAGGQAI